MAKQIIALIDFSRVSDEVVRTAGDLGEFYGAKCWLMHVAAPDPDFIGYDVGPQYIRDSRASVLKEEHQQLHVYKTSLESRGVDCEALLVMGPLYKTIEHEIGKLKADLIVLGSHGRSMLYELVVGSVCDYLLKHASVPLMILPSAK